MSEWKEVLLSDLIKIKHGFAFGGAHITTNENDNLLLTPGNFEIGGGFKQLSKPKYYHGEYPEEYLLQSGDIVVTMTDLSKQADTLGYSALIPNDNSKKYLHNQRLGKVEIKDPTFVKKEFLHWLLRGPYYRHEILAGYTGSTVKHTSPTKICAYKFYLPPVNEQEKISSILDNLDHKIENNRKINETLEGMAQAVFKSWFVDFDPVRAKMAALEAGGSEADANLAAMTAISGKTTEELATLNTSNPKTYTELATTANTFPSALVESELSPIPEGWEVKPVIKSAEYINGAAYKNMHFSNETDALPVIKIAELKNGITGNTKFTNTILDDKYRLYTGDILFSWSGSPDTSIDIFIWSLGPAWLNQHIFKVVNETVEERCFTYWLLKYLKPTFIEIARDKQTTGLGHVTKRNMEQLHYCMPDNDAFQLFFDAVGSIMGQIENNMIEIQTLTQTRDALLPKLLSGEIDVSALSNMDENA
jgi:type I restriction enzyme S subunit